MQKRTLLLILFGFFSFPISQTIYAQGFCGIYHKDQQEKATPQEGEFIDRFGNTWTAKELKTSPTAAANKDLAGIFEIQFENGFTNSEKETILAVFEYLSTLICLPAEGTPPVIEISKEALDPGALGVASPFFQPKGCHYTDNMAYVAIMGGLEPGDMNTISGYLKISNSHNWHTADNDPISGGTYDLYSVALHEALHILAFVSLITADGGPTFGMYSTWDEYLYNTDINDYLLDQVSSTTCCYYPDFNASLSFPDDVDDDCGNNIYFHDGSSLIAQVNGNYGSAALDDNTVRNILSHLDRCGTSGSQYVMNSSLAEGTTNRMLTTEEEDILHTIGYPKDCNETLCAIFGEEELVPFEPGTEIPYEAFLENDLYPNDAVISFPQYCGNIWSFADVTLTATGILVENPQYYGYFTFCYIIEGCDGDCFTVSSEIYHFPPLPDCTPCENNELFCYPDLDNFLPNHAEGLAPQLGLPQCNYDNGYLSTPDLFVTHDGGTILHIAGGGAGNPGWAEHESIPLNMPLEPECKALICLDAIGLNCENPPGIDVYGTNTPNCSGLWEPTCTTAGPYYCVGSIFPEECVSYEDAGYQGIPCSHPLYPEEYGCSTAGGLVIGVTNPLELKTYCLEIANESPVAWDQIVLSSSIFAGGGAVLIDNIHITSDCCEEPDNCGIEIVETCKENTVVLTILQDGVPIPMYNADCCISWSGIPGIPTYGCPPGPGAPSQNFNNLHLKKGEDYCVEIVCPDCEPIIHCGITGETCEGGSGPAISTGLIGLAPNPATDQLELFGESLKTGQSWIIYNAAGQVQLSGQIQSTPVQQIEIDKLQAGLYYLRLQSPDGTMITAKRFIKH
ncbi:MAG: T9SS type A sorting domain-containing protein [Bacteroidetes bacterium]|nr:T9SS type A sorting domain-containing protein [Bacteroidota bacterium]